eukprot:scaffold122730_cov24-Phaeocystis_antarctica.AAC.1
MAPSLRFEPSGRTVEGPRRGFENGHTGLVLPSHGARNTHPPTSSVPTPCERHRREMVTHGNGQ